MGIDYLEKGIYAIGKVFIINLNSVSSYKLACFLEQIDEASCEFKREDNLLFIEKK